MLLEEYIDKGILFKELLQASKRTPILLDGGIIRVGKVECTDFFAFGCDGQDYTEATILDAISKAYEVAK